MTAMRAVVFAYRWHELTAGSAASIVQDRQRVLIVHSYSDRYFWTPLIHQGFLDGLARWGYSTTDLEVKTFEMDTKQSVLAARVSA